MVNVPTLKGVHYAIESGRLAAEAMVAALRGEGSSASPPLTSYDGAVRSSFICEDLHKVRDVRQVFGRGLFVGAAFAGAMIATKGKVSLGKLRTKPDATHELLTSGRAASYPVADGKLVFDKLSSVYASGNQTSEDQPDHISVQRRVPHDIAEMLVHLCPASVYSMGERGADGLVAVDVEPSNCVQCGAISAKGGRLTPPDGGSGPEYRLA